MLLELCVSNSACIVPSQALRAPSKQKESGQKEQVQEQSRTTSGSSEETEEDEKRHKLSDTIIGISEVA